MKKTTITLSSDTVLQFPAGEVDAVVDGGTVYVPLMVAEDLGETSEDSAEDKPSKPAAKPKAEKKAAPKEAPKKAEVADDTASEEEEEAGEAYEQGPIPFEDMKEGEKYTIKLSEYPDQVFTADCVPTPAKGKKGEVYVTFHEDGETDYLREGDEVYPFGFKF